MSGMHTASLFGSAEAPVVTTFDTANNMTFQTSAVCCLLPDCFLITRLILFRLVHIRKGLQNKLFDTMLRIHTRSLSVRISMRVDV